MLVGAWLINKGDAKRTEGCDEACPIPPKDSAQNGDGQQNACSPTHTAIQVVAEQKALELADCVVHWVLKGGQGWAKRTLK